MKKILLLNLIGRIFFSFESKCQSAWSIIEASPEHQTFEDLIIAAGLVDLFDANTPLTVFAPTDAAFAALPNGTVDFLLVDNRYKES
jgi:uncharacterized surface protein with fasciclin (FAS1) repeats